MVLQDGHSGEARTAYHVGDDTSRGGLGRGTLAEEQRRRGSTLKRREVGESRASIEQEEGSKCRIVRQQKDDDRSSRSFPIVPKNASRHGLEIRGTLHRHIPFIWCMLLVSQGRQR